MKRFLIFISLITLIAFQSSTAYAFVWMIYHKPEFKGKVMDAETKEPIEGAVVVAVYNKSTIGLGAGTISSVIEVKESLTDNEGMFQIPTYTTIIQPFSWEISATFIIFKSGYGSFPNYRTSPSIKLSNPALEQFFSGEVGKEGVVRWHGELDKVTFGIVELPKLKTREERLKSRPSPVEDSEHKTIWYWKKQKQFIRLLNEELSASGLKEYKIEEWD